MRRAGLVVCQALDAMCAAVAPGVTTADLDAIAREELHRAGATSNFLGYHGYPAVVCTSVNHEIVHGIPAPTRVLRDGDIVSIDFGAVVDGWHGDAARTVPVGQVEPAAAQLIEDTEQALWAGLAAARAGGFLSDIGHAVSTRLRASGRRYGIVEEYVGHGIGTAMHMDPQVPNYAPAGPGHGPPLVSGLALAIEPMVNLGSRRTRLLDDGWTVVTDDGTPSAHFEHTVAVTDEGPWVLTAADGGRERFAALGVPTPAGARA